MIKGKDVAGYDRQFIRMSESKPGGIMRLDFKAVGIGLIAFLILANTGYLILAFTKNDLVSMIFLVLPYVGVGIGGGLTVYFRNQTEYAMLHC